MPSLPTAATLSRWLRRAGTLPRGDVLDIHIDLEHNTDLHNLVFLTATYTPDTPSALPRHLVVKTPLVQSSDDSHSHGELQFYRKVSSVLPTPPVVQCLALIGSDDVDSGTIVLEDLRATHD